MLIFVSEKIGHYIWRRVYINTYTKYCISHKVILICDPCIHPLSFKTVAKVCKMISWNRLFDSCLTESTLMHNATYRMYVALGISVDSVRTESNGRNFTDYIPKKIQQNKRNLIHIPLKCLLNDLTGHKSVLVCVLAWRRTDACSLKLPASQESVRQLLLTYNKGRR